MHAMLVRGCPINSTIRKAAIVINDAKPYQTVLAHIQSALEQNGVECLLVFSHNRPAQAPDDVDLVISLGGDGTLLYAARLFYGRNIPVFAVNLGTFGFLTEISRDEVLSSLEQLFASAHSCEHRIMLDVCLEHEGREQHFFPLNEAVIGGTRLAHLITLETHVDGEYLCDYRADGLIVSTPTGSTAYSLSANGPILMPSLDNLLLTPVCPHTLASRPLILSGSAAVQIRCTSDDAVLSLDGQERVPLVQGQCVSIKKAAHGLQLIKASERSFFTVLREKLGWLDA